MLLKHYFWNQWIIKVSGVNRHEPGGQILSSSSISSSNLLAVIETFLFKLKDVFGEIFSQFLLFEEAPW